MDDQPPQVQHLNFKRPCEYSVKNALDDVFRLQYHYYWSSVGDDTAWKPWLRESELAASAAIFLPPLWIIEILDIAAQWSAPFVWSKRDLEMMFRVGMYRSAISLPDLLALEPG